MAADTSDDTQQHTDENAKPSWFRRMWRKTWVKIALGVLVVVLLGVALLWWWNARQYESTTDAFIDTHMVNVAPQISGQVLKVYVNNNDEVDKGHLLVRIDPTQYKAKLAQAKAQLAQAKTQYGEAKAAVASAEAQATEAARDLSRYRGIQKQAPEAIAQQKVDQAVAQKQTADANVKSAQQQVDNANAQIKVAQAALHTARVNLGYAVIRAPQQGHVAQRSVAVGDYVTPGEALMTIVPDRLWVTANFKETQLDLMRPGQPVTISIDACGGAEVKGHVGSIQRGAGQAFQILPPQNATGNFVKVVQRVPVRILLDRVPKHCTLGPGMSVEPSVKVR